MLFLHPLFLVALTLVVVPVALHFLMKSKPKKLVFPAFQFLMESRQSRSRALKLRHFLLLTLRVLLIGVIVLLFARPTCRNSERAERSGAPSATLFLFDTSLRMDYVFENQTRLEHAKGVAGRILATLPSESVAAVGSPLQVPRSFLPDLSEVERQMETLETTPNVRTLPEVLADSLTIFDSTDKKQKEIYVFTDLTTRAWDGTEARSEVLADALTEALKKHPNVRVTLVDVGVEKPVNCALEIPFEQNFTPRPGGLCELRGFVHLNDSLPHRLVLFMRDAKSGRDVQRADVSVQNSGASEKNVRIPFSFEIGALVPGPNQGYIQILGEDGLKMDDRRYFTIQRDPASSVLLVCGENSKEAEERAFFMRQALAPSQFDREGRARFECTTVDGSEFARWLAQPHESARTLARYPAILLLDPTEVAPGGWSALGQYVNAGGGLGVFLGPELKNVGSFQSTEARQVLPAVPDFVARYPEGATLLPARGATHPVPETFAQLNVSIPWDAFPVFRAWTVKEPAPGVQTLFTLDASTPALLERTLGMGRVILMTTPVTAHATRSDALWNLLPQGESWVFLILANAVTQRLCAVSEQDNHPALLEPLAFPMGSEANDKFQLTRVPDGTSDVFPTITLTADLERRLIDIPPMELPGNYRVTSEKSEYTRGFSANAPIAYSDLTRVSATFFEGQPVQILRDLTDFSQPAVNSATIFDTFTVLAGILLILLLCEYGVSGRFYA